MWDSGSTVGNEGLAAQRVAQDRDTGAQLTKGSSVDARR